MPDNPPHGTPPKEIGTEGTPTLLRPWRGIYPYGLPEEAVMLDNLGACRILTPWSAEEFGLEFSRAGGARVEGRTAHDLVLTKLTSGIDPWDRLLQVFDEWSNEIEH